VKKIVKKVGGILISNCEWSVGLVGIECRHQSQVRNSMSRGFILSSEDRGEGVDDVERVVLW
jgi:hypothetical protein